VNTSKGTQNPAGIHSSLLFTKQTAKQQSRNIFTIFKVLGITNTT